MNKPEWLQRIIEREGKASRGPWKTEINPENKVSGENWTIANCGCVSGWDTDKYCFVTTDNIPGSMVNGDADTDAEFIAHARTDIPTLLSALNKAYEVIEKSPCKCIKDPVYDEHTGISTWMYTCSRCEFLSWLETLPR